MYSVGLKSESCLLSVAVFRFTRNCFTLSSTSGKRDQSSNEWGFYDAGGATPGFLFLSSFVWSISIFCVVIAEIVFGCEKYVDDKRERSRELRENISSLNRVKLIWKRILIEFNQSFPLFLIGLKRSGFSYSGGSIKNCVEQKIDWTDKRKQNQNNIPDIFFIFIWPL